MKQYVSYKGEFVSDDFWHVNTRKIVLMLKQKKIGYKDIVICKSNSHIGVYIHWLACVEIGFIPIFVSSEFSIDSIKLLNNNIGAKVVLESVGIDHYVYLISDTCSKSPFLNNIKENSIIHLTSATTGNPKLVVRTKEQIDSEITRYSKYLNIDENDSILPIVPIYTSFGFISGMLLSMKVNAKLILPDIVLPRNIIQLSNLNKATVMLGVSYFYRKMLAISSKYTLNNELRYVISSGGPMEEGLQKDFKDRFGIKLLQQYGSTETGSLCIGCSEDSYRSVGKPIPGVKFKIINDKDDKPWVYVSSPTTIGAYVTKDGIVELDKTLYKIGDLGRIKENGEVELLGRSDDVLVVDGKKVDKKMVASVIKKINCIDKVNIFLTKNNDTTELTCEYCSDKKVTKETFVNHCKTVLANYQIPKKFLKVNEMKNVGRSSWKTE